MRIKQEVEDVRIKEEPEEDCGGKGMRDETPSEKDSADHTDFSVKTEIKQEIKTEVKEEPGESAGGEERGARRLVFKPDELRVALMPTLEKLYRQDPESLPFRQPVDAQALGIPDYFDIVTKPIDLSTIKMKLDRGNYLDPWEYVDDVWLMFDNAWLYNRKNSRVYRYSTKVSPFIYVTVRFSKPLDCNRSRKIVNRQNIKYILLIKYRIIFSEIIMYRSKNSEMLCDGSHLTR